MARIRVPITVLDAAGVGVNGASVTVRKRSDNSLATLYSSEAGGATGNPASSDALGRMSVWIDRGAYKATISGTGITTYTQEFDAAPGADASIDLPWIPDGSLTSAKTADGTLGVVDTLVGAGGLASGAFLAYLSANFVATGAPVIVPFNTEVFDVSGWYDITTYRYTPQVAGYYRITINWAVSGSTGQIAPYKNGTRGPGLGPNVITNNGSVIYYMNGTTDYLDMRALYNVTFFGTGWTGGDLTWWCGELVGRA